MLTGFDTEYDVQKRIHDLTRPDGPLVASLLQAPIEQKCEYVKILQLGIARRFRHCQGEPCLKIGNLHHAWKQIKHENHISTHNQR